MKPPILVFLLFLLTAPSVGYSQQAKIFAEIHSTMGKVMPSNDYVKGINHLDRAIEQYTAYDFRLGWETLKNQARENKASLPYAGLGLHLAQFEDESFFGKPKSVYAFAGGQLTKGEKHFLNYEFSLGYSFDWLPFSYENNIYNISMGSKHCAYVNAKVYYPFTLFNTIAIQAGAHATHYSNGATSYPNKGLNILSPFVGVRYNFAKRKQEVIIETPNDNKSETETNLLFSGGYKSVSGTGRYNIAYGNFFAFSLEHLRPSKKRFRYGYAIDLGLDENQSIFVDMLVVKKAPIPQQIYLSTSLIGQYKANNIAIQAEASIKALADSREALYERFYQKIGVRYYLGDKYIVGVRIKAQNFSEASYIEWSLGYSF